LLFAPTFSFQTISTRDVATRLAELAQTAPAGRVTDIGGPEVATARELAAQYLSSTGRRRRIVPLSMPGKAFAAFASGYHLTPDNRYGASTFSDFLAEAGTG